MLHASVLACGISPSETWLSTGMGTWAVPAFILGGSFGFEVSNMGNWVFFFNLSFLTVNELLPFQVSTKVLDPQPVLRLLEYMWHSGLPQQCFLSACTTEDFILKFLVHNAGMECADRLVVSRFFCPSKWLQAKKKVWEPFSRVPVFLHDLGTQHLNT